jgi:hypothetical protein
MDEHDMQEVTVDCMACLAHAAETGDVNDVRYATVEEATGVTHYAARIGTDDAFPLCDFGTKGLLRRSDRLVRGDLIVLGVDDDAR